MFANTKSNKVLSIILSIVLVVALIPSAAFADTDNQPENSETTEQQDAQTIEAASENDSSNSDNSSQDIQAKSSEATTNSSNDNQESENSANKESSSEELQTNSNEANDQANSWRYVDGDQIYSYEGASTEAVDPYAPMPLAAAPDASSYATWYKSNGTTSYTYKASPSDSGQNIAVSGVKRVGIDVSYHNGTIDWAKVKNSGVSFAIIRCGYGSDLTSQDDTQFLNNIRGAQANGIDIGIYLYSYAMNTTGNDSSASSEAQHVLRLLNEAGLDPEDLAYPVFYDLEESKQLSLGSQKLGQLATTFCNAISAAGYEVGIYSNLNWWSNYLTDSAFNNSNWHKWAARYPGSNKATSSGVSGTEIWQFSDCGNVDGISGNVDMNFDYVGSYGINYEAIDQHLDELAAQNADVLADGTYMIRLASTNMQVVDIPGKSMVSGTNVQLWQGKMGTNQFWKVSHDEKGYVAFTNVNSGLVLDAATTRPKAGASVSQFESRDARNQKWIVTQNENGSYQILSGAMTNLSLDAYAGGTANGTKIQVWTSNGKASQEFNFVSTEAPEVAPCEDLGLDGYYAIASSLDSSVVLDVYANGTTDGTNIQLWTKTGAINQQYEFKYINGYYQIINAKSGKALNAENGNLLPTTNVSIATADSSQKSQLWSITVDDEGNYRFVNAASGLSLDIAGGSASKGANVQTYTTVDTSKYQAFTLQDEQEQKNLISDNSTYLIRFAKDANKLLDVSGMSKSENGNVEIYQSTANLNQRWYASLVDGKTNTYTFRSLNSGMYLSDVNGNAVQSSSAGESSQWVIGVSGGYYTLKNVASGNCLDVYTGSTANGTNVQTWESNGKISQQFQLEKVNIIAPGYYFITPSVNTNLAVEVESVSTANGANVQVWTKTNKDHQKWQLKVNSDGSYSVLNANSGKALDIEGKSTVSGANVSQFTNNETSNQKWDIRYNDDGSFSLISRLDSSLALNVSGSGSGSNVNVTTDSGIQSQKFSFSRTTYNPMPSDQRVMLDKAQGYSSRTGYLILVDRSTHKVGVFSGSQNNWSLRYYWSCVTGAPGTPTITGSYYTTGFTRPSLSTDSRAIYCTQIWGGYFFHSILASENELGKSLSHGCIRLPYSAANWIYNNIHVGTRVIIYN